MVRDLINRLLNRPSAEGTALQQEVQEISARAFELAIGRYRAGDVLDTASVNEAAALQKTLEAKVDLLRHKYPASYEELSHEISEATLDLDYALEGGNVTSLRLSRFIDDEVAMEGSNGG